MGHFPETNPFGRSDGLNLCQYPRCGYVEESGTLREENAALRTLNAQIMQQLGEYDSIRAKQVRYEMYLEEAPEVPSLSDCLRGCADEIEREHPTHAWELRLAIENIEALAIDRAALREELAKHYTPCPHCDFSSGQRGMDRCTKCDGTGRISVVDRLVEERDAAEMREKNTSSQLTSLRQRFADLEKSARESKLTLTEFCFMEAVMKDMDALVERNRKLSRIAACAQDALRYFNLHGEMSAERMAAVENALRAAGEV